MKKLLLTSAIVAVSGAAAAEITWSGDAVLEWRGHTDAGAEVSDDIAGVQNNGLSLEADLNASASAELDNGISVTLDYGFGLEYASEAGNTVSEVTLDNFPTLTFESSVATLTVGDVETSYVSTFDDTFMEEVDGELVATLDTTFGPAALGVSYVIDGSYGSTDDGRRPLSTDIYTVVASGEFSGFKVAAGVAADASPSVTTENGFASDMGPIIGIMAGYELNGIDIAAKYQTQSDWAIGVGLAQADRSLAELDLGYTMSNGISLGAEFDSLTIGDADAVTSYEISAGFEALGADIEVSYSDTIDDQIALADGTFEDVDGTFAIDASYEVLEGLTVYAGADQGEKATLVGSDVDAWGIYAATSYDLGGGASVYASYATYHEAGDAEYNNGATVGLSLSF